MKQRKHPRIVKSGIMADISDGERFFSGYVNNLSRFGLCLEEVPERIDHEARRISVVISGKGTNFKMVTRPCWSWQHGTAKMLGLEILTAPVGWTEFVREHEPIIEDSWAEVIL